jgi:hypothetical protein
VSTAVVKSGKCAWTGSAKPNANHEDVPRLRASTTAHAYLRMRSPVPDGDSVTSASLRIVVASGAAGSVTFTLKRVTSRPHWDELTWNNEPTVASTTVTATVSDPADGTAVTLDVTSFLQSIAGGSANYGWRLEASAAVKVYGFDSQNPPKLTVDSSSAPAQPTDLWPAGIGSLAKPHIVFSAPDVTGEAEVQSVQVQLSASSSPAADASGTWTSPTFDTGEVTSLTPDLDLAATAYGGLAADATIYWHVRWKSGGQWSPWSDTVSYLRKTWGTLTVSNPSGGVVLEPTPPFIIGYAAGIRRYRMQVVLASDQTKVVAASDWLDGASATSVSWTPAKPLHDSTNYVLLADVVDANKRTPSPGDPRFLRASTAFTATFDASVGAPTLTSVAQHPTLPLPLLTFTRSTAPDSFTVRRDGLVVAADLDPADLFTTGTTYQWVDPTADASEHTYSVAAVVNDKRSTWSSSIAATVAAKGLWLISTDLQRFAVLLDTNSDGWEVKDETALFAVVGASHQVQIEGALGVLEGTVTGTLMAPELMRTPLTSATVAEMAADITAMREAREPVIMVAPGYAHTVRLRNVLVKPHNEMQANQDVRSVSFAFIETDD